MPIKPFSRDDYDYSVVTGRLYVRGRFTAGNQWGKAGYRCVMLDGKRVAMHRFIWFWVTGEWPEHDVDHMNRIKWDNRWINLRDADDKTNTENRGPHKNNVLQVRGVRIIGSGKYDARIMHKGVSHHLGTYDTIEEANQARRNAEKIYFTHAI